MKNFSKTSVAVIGGSGVDSLLEKSRPIRVGTPFGLPSMISIGKIGEKTIPQTFIETFGNCKIISRSSGYRVLLGEKN